MTAVVTDSAASLPRALASELGIEVVPLYVRFGDEVHLDGQDEFDFYARLRDGGEMASTASPSPGDFLAGFERTGATDIVCVTVASTVSGAHGAAMLAARDFPGHVEVIDSGNASMGEGLVAIAAARAAAEGAGIDEVAARARDVAGRVRLVATIDTFDYLRRSGRVSRLAAYAGARLSIRPIFAVAGGEITPVARPRTRARALHRIVEEVVEAAGGKPIHLAVVHADAEPEARAVLERIESEADVADRVLSEFTPAMGAHTGPGVVGAAWFTED